MTIYLLLILLSLLIFHLVVRYNKAARIINKLPGPTPLPIFGNLLEMNVSPEKQWIMIREYAKHYEILKVWLLTAPLVIMQHPEDIKLLISSKNNINKTSYYDNLKFFWGDGVAVTAKDLWKQRRKLVNPAFSPNMIRANSVIVSEHGENLITYLKSQGDETVHSLVPLIKKLMMGIICEAAMGVNVNKCKLEGGDKFIRTFHYVNTVTYYRVTHPYITDWMMKWLPIGQKQNQCIAESHAFRDKIIEERRKYLDRTGYPEYQSFEDSADAGDNNKDKMRPLPLLDILLLAEKNGAIDSRGVDDEVTTFISTGYDTTALTICYTLMLLAENKEAQERARTEISEIYHQSNGKITDTETRKLEYLNRCVKEALRLFPIVPHIGRQMSEGQQLRDYYIPANTDVIIDIFDLHRNPKIWPQPDKFDPDRFLPEHVQERHPFSYLPFSMGIRNCIGMKYGMMAVKTILAHILYNFYLEPIERISDIRFEVDVSLNAINPLHVKFIKINRVAD